MMKKLILIFVVLIVTIALAASNIITYTASNIITYMASVKFRHS